MFYVLLIMCALYRSPTMRSIQLHVVYIHVYSIYTDYMYVCTCVSKNVCNTLAKRIRKPTSQEICMCTQEQTPDA